MYIECNIKEIQKIISFAEKVSSKNSTLPALETILFDAGKNNCEIKATNLSLGFSGSIPANVKKPGIVAVKASIIGPVLININEDGVVTIKEEDGFLVISTKNTTAKCLTTPNEDFPTIPFGGDVNFSIENTEIVNLLKSTYFSASQSEIKPELSSVYLYTNEGFLYAVATDGYRLSERRVKSNIKDLSILIPVKNIPDILRIITEWSSEIKISFNKNQLTFSDIKNQTLLSTRIIDGDFPDYKQIIPINNQTTVMVLKDDILKNIRLSNVFTDKFNHIKFNIDSVNNNLSIYAGSVENGEVESIIPAKIDGEGLLINFNYKYFIECFQVIEDQTIVLKLNAPNKPMIIQGSQNKDYLYLVMPLNR